MDRRNLDNIMEIASKKLASDGYRCIEAEWDGGEKILRLFVDRINSEVGTIITIDECVSASHLLNEVEEIEKAVSSPFHLEVSSPGIERPVRLAFDFQKMIGSKVQVKLSQKINERKNAVGTVKAVEVPTSLESGSESLVTIETETGDWSFGLKNLKKANLVFDWNSRIQ